MPSNKQPITATFLFGNGRVPDSDSEDEHGAGAAKFFSKHYNPTAQRGKYDDWKKQQRKAHKEDEKQQAHLEEAVQIQRESKMTNMQLRIRALEQEVEQHRFMALARHREMAKLNALPCLERADNRARKLWLAKQGVKPKKKARYTEETLYDSDELYEPGLSDVEEVHQYKPAQRPMEESMSEGEDDPEFIAKPAKGSKLAKQMKSMGKVDHKAASIAGAKAVIDKAIDKNKNKSKGKAKAKADKPKQKKVMAPYIFFAKEMMPTVADEGVPAGPERMRRIAALWKEQKESPEGIAKWTKLSEDAKAARATETNDGDAGAANRPVSAVEEADESSE